MKKGDSISWKWGQGKAEGKIIEIKKEKTSIKTKGEEIHRNATKDDQAIIIEQDNGTRVLKLTSELD